MFKKIAIVHKTKMNLTNLFVVLELRTVADDFNQLAHKLISDAKRY